MIIPIKCFTCGNVLGVKYRFYQEQVRQLKLSERKNVNKVVHLIGSNSEKTPEGIVLDNLQLKNVCCRTYAHPRRY